MSDESIRRFVAAAGDRLHEPAAGLRLDPPKVRVSGYVGAVEFTCGSTVITLLCGPPEYEVCIKLAPVDLPAGDRLDLASLLENRELMAWAMDNKLSGCRPDDYGAQIDWFLKLLAKARTVAGFEYLD